MENLEPKTRLEQFLSAIAGNDIELPEVKTRLEYFLKEIADNGGGGGSSDGGGLVIVFPEKPLETLPDWIPAGMNAQFYETNVTYSELSSALSSRTVSAYFPDADVYRGDDLIGQMCVCAFVEGEMPGSEGIFGVQIIIPLNRVGRPLNLYAYGENGKLGYLVEISE